MVYFCADIGNTLVKWAIFQDNQLLESATTDHFEVVTINSIAEIYPDAVCIVSSTRQKDALPESAFQRFRKFIPLSHQIPMPFVNRYKTPETLGLDRMALVAAAVSAYPCQDVLVIDAGTCITLDFVDKHAQYLGGSIHPGLTMRLKAMHQFTGRLPLLPVHASDEIMGNDTISCMLAGAINAAAIEIDAFISVYKARYPGCTVILTGGDGHLFFSLLKNEIFALPNFAIQGLLKIAQYNV
jgi:type III pantothenate kinase